MTDAQPPMTFNEAILWLQTDHGHTDCEDCWYSCATLTCDETRKSDVCDCGGDAINEIKAKIAKMLIAERERVREETIEECARVCEAIVAEWKEDSEAHAEKQNFHVAVAGMHYKNGADECVSAIRDLSRPVPAMGEE